MTAQPWRVWITYRAAVVGHTGTAYPDRAAAILAAFHECGRLADHFGGVWDTAAGVAVATSYRMATVHAAAAYVEAVRA
jgi:hypothetical protein